MPGTLETIWAVLAALYFATVAVTLISFGRRRVPDGVALARASVIVPIKGANPFLAANVEALARLEPLAGEVLLAVAAADDAAVPVLAPLVARYPDRLRLLVGEAPEFANPKLRNLAKAWRAAAEDTILFLDDNVTLDAGLYRELLGALGGRTAACHGGACRPRRGSGLRRRSRPRPATATSSASSNSSSCSAARPRSAAPSP